MLFWTVLLAVDSMMLGFTTYRLIENPSVAYGVFALFWAGMALSSILKLVGITEKQKKD